MVVITFFLFLTTFQLWAANDTFRAVRSSNRVLKLNREWELDTDAMLKDSTFKIKPDRLIERCKEVIDNEIGLKNADDLADNFVFQFPIIGPLTKDQYITAVKGFEVRNAFPDLNYGYHHFRVDPFEPNRVWCTAVFRGTNTGASPLGKPTGKNIETPPQALSFTFDEFGKLVKFTGGYVMDKTLGNTGGLGGVFGLFYGIGKPLPFPEAKPWKPSFQFRFFSFLGQLASYLTKK